MRHRLFLNSTWAKISDRDLQHWHILKSTRHPPPPHHHHHHQRPHYNTLLHKHYTRKSLYKKGCEHSLYLYVVTTYLRAPIPGGEVSLSPTTSSVAISDHSSSFIAPYIRGRPFDHQGTGEVLNSELRIATINIR